MTQKSGANKVIVGGGIYEESATQQHPLGTPLELGSKVFRYARAGATGLNKCELQESSAPATEHDFNLSVATAGVVGDMSVEITVGAANITENFYAGGMLLVNDGTSVGDSYTISGHAAVSSGADGVFHLKDPLRGALAVSATSEVGLFEHELAGTVQAGANPGDLIVGVPLIDVTATYYYWAQTHGLCPLLMDGSAVTGDPLEAAASGVATVNGAVTEPAFGWCWRASADASHPGVAFLLID